MDIELDLTLDVKLNESVDDISAFFEFAGYSVDSCQLFFDQQYRA